MTGGQHGRRRARGIAREAVRAARAGDVAIRCSCGQLFEAEEIPAVLYVGGHPVADVAPAASRRDRRSLRRAVGRVVVTTRGAPGRPAAGLPG